MPRRTVTCPICWDGTCPGEVVSRFGVPAIPRRSEVRRRLTPKGDAVPPHGPQSQFTDVTAADARHFSRERKGRWRTRDQSSEDRRSSRSLRWSRQSLEVPRRPWRARASRRLRARPRWGRFAPRRAGSRNDVGAGRGRASGTRSVADRLRWRGRSRNLLAGYARVTVRPHGGV